MSAKKQLLLTPTGTPGCEALRYRSKYVKTGVAFGRVCKVPGGYEGEGTFSSATFKTKTKAAAIRAIVRQRQHNLNLEPGQALYGTRRKKRRK